jgi:Cu2+-exporting ATPase
MMTILSPLQLLVLFALAGARALLLRPKTAANQAQSTAPSAPLPAAMERLGKHSFERIARLTSVEDPERARQLASLSSDADTVPDAHERAGYRELGYALSALGVGFAGRLLYPPLAVLSAPLLAIIGVGRARLAYRSLSERRQLDLSAIDTLICIALLATGSFVSGAFGYTVVAASSIMLSRIQTSSRRKLIDIFGQRPRTAWVRVDGVVVECPIEEVVVGIEVVVGAGEVIPVDGVVVEGQATVDQQALTGESEYVLREPGDTVLATTMIRSGRVVICAERTGPATTAGQIGEMLERTSADNLDVQLRSERLGNASVLPTLVLSGLALGTIGPSASLASLVASYGWSLRLLTPLSLYSFLTVCSQRGILIKDGRGLEGLAGVDTVVFDKTGTLTLDRLQVTDIHCFEATPATEVLRYAAMAEQRQSHPIARAILDAAAAKGIAAEVLDDIHYELGRGIAGTLDGVSVRVGNERFMHDSGIEVPAAVHAHQQATQEDGGGLVMVAIGGRLVGGIEWRATLRPETPALVTRLRQRGLKVLIISGDREAPTRSLAHELGVDGYHAEVLPADKSGLIEAMQADGRSVCFVGDGINDTLALRASTVSISLSGGTSAAVDTAQIILMDGSLRQLDGLFEIAARFDANMSRNFATSVIPSVICTFGAFFLRMGFVSAIVVQTTGIAVGVRNALGARQAQLALDAEPNNSPLLHSAETDQFLALDAELNNSPQVASL